MIDEAHKQNVRVTAHLFTLEDGKGLLKAGLDAFAHGVRDCDIDDEFVKSIKARSDIILVPNLPDAGVVTDLAFLSEFVAAEELTKLQAGVAKERPEAQKAFGIQARNLARLNKEASRSRSAATATSRGVRISNGGHGGGRHDAVERDRGSDAQAFAELLTLTDMGTVEAGKSADFVVLDAEPAGRHHEHAQDLHGVSAGRRSESRRNTWKSDDVGVERGLSGARVTAIAGAEAPALLRILGTSRLRSGCSRCRPFRRARSCPTRGDASSPTGPTTAW